MLDEYDFNRLKRVKRNYAERMAQGYSVKINHAERGVEMARAAAEMDREILIELLSLAYQVGRAEADKRATYETDNADLNALLGAVRKRHRSEK